MLRHCCRDDFMIWRRAMPIPVHIILRHIRYAATYATRLPLRYAMLLTMLFADARSDVAYDTMLARVDAIFLCFQLIFHYAGLSRSITLRCRKIFRFSFIPLTLPAGLMPRTYAAAAWRENRHIGDHITGTAALMPMPPRHMICYAAMRAMLRAVLMERFFRWLRRAFCWLLYVALLMLRAPYAR